MTIWMKVTADEYELPMAVADSAAELARMVGCNENCIYSVVSKIKKGKTKHGRYRKVEVDDDE